MDFSVIIPTRNRRELLSIALKSILAQRLQQGEFEVIVVDNGSTDGTGDMIGQMSQSEPRLRYHFADEPGLHVGRHAGLKVASADLLVYVDDDIRAFDGWLAALASAFAEPAVAMAGGKALPDWEGSPPYWIYERWMQPRDCGQMLEQLSLLDLGTRPHAIDPYLVFGCNFAVRKQVVLDAGGFHPDGMPQEMIRYRGDGESHIANHVRDQGLIAWYQPEASVWHRVSASRMTEDYFCRREFNEGISQSYSRIRATGSVDAPGDAGHERPGLIRRKLGRSLRRLLGPEFQRMLEHGTLNIDGKMRAAREAGYRFHQHAAANDEQLMNWIVRKDYF